MALLESDDPLRSVGEIMKGIEEPSFVTHNPETTAIEESLEATAMEVDGDVSEEFERTSFVTENLENLVMNERGEANPNTENLVNNEKLTEVVETPFVVKNSENVNVIRAEETRNFSEFANSGFDEERGETRVETEHGSGARFVVVQSQQKQAMTAAKSWKKDWPTFIGIPNELSTDADRQLRMGDEVEVISFDWRKGYEELSDGIDKERDSLRPWINVGNINAQATATNVKICRTSRVTPKIGLVLHVNRRGGQSTNSVQNVVVISQGMEMTQQIPRWSLGEKDWFRIGQVVLLETVGLTHPNQWKVNPGYALPLACPFGSQNDRKAHQPTVAIGVDRSPILHKFPFRRGDSNAIVEQGEQVIAAATTACLDKILEDIARFTIVAEPSVELGKTSGTAIVSIRHFVEKKQDLVDMTRIWSEDNPVHVRLAHEGAKPCAIGFILNVERQDHPEGFELLASLFLAFQEAKDYDSSEAWDRIMDGEPMEVEPLQSVKILTQRAMKFAMNQFSETAKDKTGLGRIMAILMARHCERVVPECTWEKLFVAHNPALNELVGGQRETAELMLDSVPRVVYQQAPPGTGKTKVSTDVIAAHLRANPDAQVLFIAPLNVAVVKAVEEMAKTMERIGWKEEMLALFSGAGKKRYSAELSKIGPHLLATALRAPHLLEQMDRQQKNVINRYIKACETSPRTANEGKAVQILLSKEKRRIVFCTLALAEQIGGIFDSTDMIIIDESGQAPFAQTLSTLIGFPNLNKILITGDRWQLRVNLQEVPQATRQGCGLDTTILNLDEAAGVDRTTLTVNFRSHPILTKCVEAGVYAAHDEKLIAGRDAKQMDGLTARTPILLPVRACPLILIHQTDPMQEDPTSFSATNPMQTQTAMDCLTKLRPIFQGTIRIVCFYAGQAKELGTAVAEQCMPSVLVTTVDGCQGHEAEFVMVVTTKTGVNAADASGAFWNDERRVNVALSRSKFGMMVIGDLKLLWAAGGIWRRFLRKALETTMVVTPEYIDVMTDPGARHSDGRIIGPNGPIRAENFYNEWNGPDNPAPAQAQTERRTPCPTRPGTSQQWTNTDAYRRNATIGRCHNCQRTGHFSRDCPERDQTPRSAAGRQWFSATRGGRRNN